MKNAAPQNNLLLKALFSVFMFLFFIPVFAQKEKKEQEKAIHDAKKYMQEAEEAVAEKNFASAEAFYRQAIAKDPANATARYNLGNLYIKEDINNEAVERHTQAAAVASRKPIKHDAFHNKGNAFMEQKKYKEAIEAYKNSLRNNPEDDETRYNLALAKDLWEKEQEKNQDKDQKDQNKDQSEDQKKDNKEQEGDQGEQEQKEEGKPKDDKGDKEDQKKKEGGDKEEKQEPKQPQEKGDKGKQEKENKQQQPVPGQLSPQQVKNLLEAMSNQEKQVQEKINAEKAKGAKVKTGKDW